ncbi:MAG TPA: epoxide hydrolase [Acetobacteraceae bacterium]|jgi:pimeloyl-ACP methyl ester carboxylesterase|nr:epoxide hydrolase [Acetobacteraceae bacterium]
MTDIQHRFIDTNGIRMHIAEKGAGPLVLLCHGFPESWYSWRHQIHALAAAGYRVVAPDMRGYGQTEAPEAIDQYTLMHLVGDMVGVLDALGEQTAVIAGHDWGGPVAWHTALMRPDRFRAVIGLSVPYRPRGKVRPTSVMPRTDDAVFYQLYFQQPGVAEADLEDDVRVSVRGVLLRIAGEAAGAAGGGFSMVPVPGGMRERTRQAAQADLPAWLTQADIDFYAGEFTRTGFRGGLNWYRNIDRNWEILAPFAGAKVTVPALYVAGDRDLVLAFPGAAELVAGLKAFVPQLRETVMLPGCGHWTQQERPEAVNAAMIGFLRGL